jgi:predicted CoA-binding protein
MAETLVDVVAETIAKELARLSPPVVLPNRAARAALAAIDAAGYAVVPKEPSEAMQEALFLGSYEDMLNAALKVNPSP